HLADDGGGPLSQGASRPAESRAALAPSGALMEFQGEFKVPGRPEDVIREFADVERMAKLMPGASLEGRDEEGNYLGVMTVAFGPKRIKFKGKVAIAIDEATKSGSMRGRGAA